MNVLGDPAYFNYFYPIGERLYDISFVDTSVSHPSRNVTRKKSRIA
jgi:hypothetical protein